MSLFEQHHLFHIPKFTGLEDIEIDTTGEAGGIPFGCVMPGPLSF